MNADLIWSGSRKSIKAPYKELLANNEVYQEIRLFTTIEGGVGTCKNKKMLEAAQ